MFFLCEYKKEAGEMSSLDHTVILLSDFNNFSILLSLSHFVGDKVDI